MENFNFTVCSHDKLNLFICETNLNKTKKYPWTFFKINPGFAGLADDYNITAGNTTNDIMDTYAD